MKKWQEILIIAGSVIAGVILSFYAVAWFLLHNAR